MYYFNISEVNWSQYPYILFTYIPFLSFSDLVSSDLAFCAIVCLIFISQFWVKVSSQLFPSVDLPLLRTNSHHSFFFKSTRFFTFVILLLHGQMLVHVRGRINYWNVHFFSLWYLCLLHLEFVVVCYHTLDQVAINWFVIWWMCLNSLLLEPFGEERNIKPKKWKEYMA